MLSDNNLLLRALRLNATFAGFSALAMFVSGGWMANQLGLASAIPVYVTAAMLVLFGLQLWNIVRTRNIRTWEIVGIVAADITWVAASAILVAVYYESLTAVGFMLVDIVAFAVLFFAIQQIRGLKEFRRMARS